MTDILAAIDAEIASLQQARALITGAGTTTAKRGPGRPPKGSGAKALTQENRSQLASKVRQKRKMSKEGRARLIAAVKARWAKAKAAKKQA